MLVSSDRCVSPIQGILEAIQSKVISFAVSMRIVPHPLHFRIVRSRADVSSIT